jgi:VanZ family protein
MFLRFNAFALIWALVMLYLSVTPGQQMPDTAIWNVLTFDKFAHFASYALLVFLLIVGFTKQHTYMELRFSAVKYALLTGITYGLLIEIIQWLVPGRTFELGDLLANIIGCLLGTAVFYLVYKFKIPG